MKTGIGYDVHQLAEGEKLILGGVKIPSKMGAVGHSDGDALLHAIVDALLGAANLGDIGKLFPSEDDQWKNGDSLHFLNVVGEKVRSAGFEINNIDSVIILQKPKLAGFIPEMKYKIAYTLQLDESQVSVKATTTDHLGYIGEGKGIAAQAIAILKG
ncbi:MAG: 2-C-methyl-D-erythritol 2,4-cyclodiphosphate synthase [Candidatus Marinimicrobia bacterium]|nr:2-C-methyl-D-erythritol 2,4-cyclodiphosphate synthase [Candidatus Neomarinimicrobiota bacterium]MBL7011167.1 2-C-methyl-D-erythritol 2,4-cyclodiphosphate synthase [Candidatus Neomarinimicrobiota bacterium]MBL7030526.1 2-C-methyl-D-erythritol 2,4-cyclodiphosphate synthase [Candidatus Neomarinimicrobiota bacterium]